MLLRREVARGVEILAVWGPVADSDAPVLLTAITDAVALSPRGVLLDLTDATDLSPLALQAIREGHDLAPGWPRPALLVCCTSDEVTAGLDAALPVHARREDGFAHADDRRSPQRHKIELDSGARSPARARAAAAEVVADLHLEPMGDDLALVVSELVTNAVRHAKPPVCLEIQADDERVTVAVADGSPGRPVAREPTEDAEGGRGLALVHLLAAETGVRPNPPGKTVWAALTRR
ncbi:MAG: ATP-binding protein [Frankiaceae bacterium]|nr:ATP-binding protein [Frankiaceae bacterium]